MIKKILGYILILASLYFSFYRGKREGELECIDFNVLPFIANSITIIVCITLIIVGIALIKNNTLKN
jgi:hypothetical protein